MIAPDRHAEDLALYAMGLLEDDEQAALHARLRASAADREELAQINGDLSAFALSAEMHSPPALVRQRLLARIAGDRPAPRSAPRSYSRPQQPIAPPVAQPVAQPVAPPIANRPNPYSAQYAAARPAPPPVQQPVQPSESAFASYAQRAARFTASHSGEHAVAADTYTRSYELADTSEPHRSLYSILAPYAGWTIAACLALFAALQYNERIAAQQSLAALGAQMNALSADASQSRDIVTTLTAPNSQVVTVMADGTPPAGPCGKVIYTPDNGNLTFIATNLDPLGPYKSYELWLLPADGHAPIPAGTFKPDARGYANILLPQIPKGIPARQFVVTIEDDPGSQTPTMPTVLSGA
jgi:anti-sigma-K factor RskA